MPIEFQVDYIMIKFIIAIALARFIVFIFDKIFNFIINHVHVKGSDKE